MNTVRLTEAQKHIIEKYGMVPFSVMDKLFLGRSINFIRDCLEENGIDRHTTLELKSTEVAVLTPRGIFMEVRKMETGRLGLWGGPIVEDITPRESARESLYNEAGIPVMLGKLELVEQKLHEYEYPNGDRAYFHTYRFVMKLNYIPDMSSVEYRIVRPKSMDVSLILDHQQEFVKKLLKKEY